MKFHSLSGMNFAQKQIYGISSVKKPLEKIKNKNKLPINDWWFLTK